MLSASFLLRAMQRLPFGWGEARRWLLPRLASQVGPSIRSEIYGRRCEFHLDNTCESKFLMSPLAYNRTEIDFVLSGLKQNGATFVDIGANAGIYSFAVAARTRRPVKIIAVEPNPDMCARLNRNMVELNDFGRDGLDLSVEATALGAETGTVWLDTSTGFGTAQLAEIGTKGHEVPLDSLVNLCQRHELESIDVLKIDVEGYENTILSAFFSESDPSLWPKSIVIEHFADENAELLERLPSLGYRRVKSTRNNLLFQRP